MIRLLLTLLLVVPVHVPAYAQESDAETERARRLLVRGLTQMQIGDAEAALESLDMALQLAPAEPGILATVAAAQAELGDLPAAIFYAERAAELDSRNPDIAVQLAELYAKTGNTSAAAEVFGTLTRRYPNSIDAALHAAQFFASRHDTETTASIILETLNRHGVSATVLTAASDLSSSADDAVEQSLIEYLDRGNSSVDEVWLVADWVARAAEGRYDQLIAYLDGSHPEIALSDLPPTPSHAEESRRSFATEDGGYDALAAARAQEIRVEDNPRNVANWVEASRGYLDAGYPGDAWRIAEEAQILFPGHQELRVTGAQALIELGETDQARILLERSASEAGPSSLILLGFLDAISGQNDAAIRSLGVAEQFPVSTTLRAYMTMALGMVGRVEVASTEATFLLQEFPQHPLVLEAAGWVRFLQGDSERAAELLHSAAEIGAPRARVIDRLAKALDASGRADDAATARSRLEQ